MCAACQWMRVVHAVAPMVPRDTWFFGTPLFGAQKTMFTLMLVPIQAPDLLTSRACLSLDVQNSIMEQWNLAGEIKCKSPLCL